MTRSVVVGEFAEGATCYLPACEIHRRATESPRAIVYKWGGEIRTARLPGDTWLKALDSFSGLSMEEVREFVTQSGRHAGVPAPSSFPAVWRALFRSPRARWTLNSLFYGRVSGGWQQAIRKEVPAPSYTYDLVSAYAWAGMQGLPDPQDVHFGKVPEGDAWVAYADFRLPTKRIYPYPLRSGRNRGIISAPEAALYGATRMKVVDAVIPGRTTQLAPTLRFIRDHFSAWKKIFRVYWGLWISTQGVSCESWNWGEPEKTWVLPAVGCNLLWAHLIVSRVKMRVWKDAAGETDHVFVDSIITRRKMCAVGDDVGDWRLVRTHKYPLQIFSPGCYAEGRRMLKHAGHSADDLSLLSLPRIPLSSFREG